MTGGDDPDELEVYGTDTTTGPTLTSYKFEVHTLLYIALFVLSLFVLSVL